MKVSNLLKTLLFLAITSVIIIVLFGITNPFLETGKVVPVSNETVHNVRLATNVSNEDMVAVFKNYAKPDDVIEVRARELDKLNSIKNGIPLLIYGKNDDQLKSFSLAEEHEIKMIGYNLEDVQMTLDELVEKEKVAYTLAKEKGLFFIFAPLAIHTEKYGSELAKNADAIAIQLRNYQLMENFTDKVKDISANIRDSNPDIEVWVQLDVNARVQGNQNVRQALSDQEIIDQINQIQDDVDLISIFYPPNDASVAMDVFVELRK